MWKLWWFGEINGSLKVIGMPSYSTLFVKSRHFNLPRLYLAPPLGVTPFEFYRDFQRRKTRVPGRSSGVVCVIVRLAVSVEDGLDGRTDRQTWR